MNDLEFSPQMLMGKRLPPYQILKVLEDGGNLIALADWAVAGDALAVDTSVLYSVRGGTSIILATDADKSANAYCDFINDRNRGDLTAYAHDWVYGWFYFTPASLLYLGSYFQMLLGLSDMSKFMYKNFTPGGLVSGWNILKFDLDNPTGNIGAFDLSSTTLLRVEHDQVAGNTHDFTIYLGYVAFVRPLK